METAFLTQPGVKAGGKVSLPVARIRSAEAFRFTLVGSGATAYHDRRKD